MAKAGGDVPIVELMVAGVKGAGSTPARVRERWMLSLENLERRELFRTSCTFWSSAVNNKFFSVFSFLFITFMALPAFAGPESHGGAGLAIAASFGLGIAAFGGALSQGRTAAAALEGIARNPGAQNKIFTPMILGLALIESLVIYALIIAFLIQGKI